jgi:hypothetical protein
MEKQLSNLGAEGRRHRESTGRRILSTQVGSERFRKFSTLLYFSTAYQLCLLPSDDWIYTVMNMELLQFYYTGYHKMAARSKGVLGSCE